VHLGRVLYHLNQFRLARKSFTYGDLVGEWLAEYERRRNPDYKAPIASQGKYNRYIGDFFADEETRGKSLRDASTSWNLAKRTGGDRAYKPRPTRRTGSA